MPAGSPMLTSPQRPPRALHLTALLLVQPVSALCVPCVRSSVMRNNIRIDLRCSRPCNNVRQRAMMKGSTENRDDSTTTLAIAVIGVAAQPIFWASLYSVATTGGGLPPGPFGVLGLIEGLSYLAVVFFVGAALLSKVRTGAGLAAGPFCLLGLAEGLSFLSATAGLVVLTYVATGQGCVPNALPIADYSGVVNVCR